MELIVQRGERADKVVVERQGELWHVRIGDTEYRVDAAPVAGTARTLRVDGRQFEVDVAHRGGGRYEVSRSGWVEELNVQDPLSYLARQTHARGAAQGPQTVSAYMPGRVVAVLVEEGSAVSAGAGVVVLEAMKMENEIQAERDGTVRRILVGLGEAVEGGDPLFEIE